MRPPTITVADRILDFVNLPVWPLAAPIAVEKAHPHNGAVFGENVPCAPCGSAPGWGTRRIPARPRPKHGVRMIDGHGSLPPQAGHDVDRALASLPLANVLGEFWVIEAGGRMVVAGPGVLIIGKPLLSVKNMKSQGVHFSLHQGAGCPNDETLAEGRACSNRISMIPLTGALGQVRFKKLLNAFIVGSCLP